MRYAKPYWQTTHIARTGHLCDTSPPLGALVKLAYYLTNEHQPSCTTNPFDQQQQFHSPLSPSWSYLFMLPLIYCSPASTPHPHHQPAQCTIYLCTLPYALLCILSMTAHQLSANNIYDERQKIPLQHRVNTGTRGTRTSRRPIITITIRNFPSCLWRCHW